ncbi:hypothetical protein SLEP1_g34014 [Rubroshorea leprosula]|uniref:Maturase K n=1 Tax=Rubroshorea leprosula TaxID=152421 RepID=A0AAV5KIH0_9ROSI|nr:hypothetical protein SLEP1_g34014 [Rubroshorea leprosula]
MNQEQYLYIRSLKGLPKYSLLSTMEFQYHHSFIPLVLSFLLQQRRLFMYMIC